MTEPAAPTPRRRARDFGLPLLGATGTLNAITDVPGVEVGYTTIVSGDGPLATGRGPVRTGVTVVLPLGRGGVGRSCPAGWSSFNGNGEMTGTAWLDEAGGLGLPIGITSTHSVGPVHQGIIDWSIRSEPSLARRWHLPVVAETWDGYLNDINGGHVTAELTGRALDSAHGGAIEEGSVGGGTGMNCYGFKGGTGTASRRVEVAGRAFVVGVLIQANFGSRRELTVCGRRLGEAWDDDNPMETDDWLAPAGAGSCIAVVATNAPLLPGQCKALTRRVPLGLGRTGTTGSHFSGDLAVAFSATNVGALDSGVDSTAAEIRSIDFLPWGAMDTLYTAVVHAVEEAVLNALVAARTMIGRDGHRSPGIPLDRLSRAFGALRG